MKAVVWIKPLALCQAFGVLARGTAYDRIGTWSDKHEANDRRVHYIGITVAADKYELRAASAYGEANQFPCVSRDRFHRDVEKLAEWLVEIIKTQSRADFGRTQIKSQRNGSGVDIVERNLDGFARSLVAKPELKDRKDDEVQLNRFFDKWECRATQNFVRIVANLYSTRSGFHCLTDGIDAFRATDRDCFPNRDFESSRGGLCLFRRKERSGIRRRVYASQRLSGRVAPIQSNSAKH